MIATLCRLSADRSLSATPVNDEGPQGRVLGEWVGTVPEAGGQVLYFVHGGGYVVGSEATHRGLVTALADRIDRPAFSVRYRLGPEHRFPAASVDVLNGYLWLVARGHRPEDIVVAGDSAGGHLVLGLCGELRKLGLPQPKGGVLMSPLVDPSYTLSAALERTVSDPFATARAGRRITALYTRGADVTDPRFDVLRIVGPDLAPLLIQVGEHEILKADADAFVKAQRAAGGQVELQVWPEQFHVFQMSHRQQPAARAALDEIALFVEGLDAVHGLSSTA
ncbi:alpha/beta hydrolase [Nocardioides sp. WS12]|uniref:alpha/beta hydrolase n=1 Tax=Nocardioides sp. WS12 TaxID=2486272 RepID=UPI00191ED79D|nr:alpha/beta hydrolase [Nocardioides sp. WS12]